MSGEVVRTGIRHREGRELVVWGAGFEMRVLVLDGFLLRLRGLLGTRRGEPGARPVLIVPCSSVHTCAMRYPIDVAMVNERGEVVFARRNVVPWRFVGCRAAAHVLERPSSAAPWPAVGEQLHLRGPDEPCVCR